MNQAPPRILVVDDDDDVRELCVRLLTLEGYQIDAASSAEEVYEHGNLSSYQVALTDIRLPGTDGLSLVRWIRKLNPQLGIVAMTGYPSIENAIQALRAGVSDFLVKPFSLEEIKRVVGKCLERLRLSQDLAHINEALTSVNQELERTNYLQTQFLSMVSHEMRTPLNVVLQLVQLIVDKKVPLQQVDETLLHIKDESIRMKNLLETLYDFSRLRAGKVNLALEPLILKNLIAEYLALLSHQLAGWNVVLNIPGDLPLVLADKDRVVQIITNLLSNAVKYSLPGTKIEINGSLRKSKTGQEFVQVAILDQGCGIPKEDLPYIFEAFYRGQQDHLGQHVSKKSSPGIEAIAGLGLGLSIVKIIVQLMGGDIKAKSVLGKGSKFIFTLPVAPASKN